MITSRSYEQKTAFNGAAIALTLPAGCRKAWLQAEGTNVRFRLDGTNPTASVGGVLVAGAAHTEITVEAGLGEIKLIGVDGSSKLNIHYFSMVASSTS